MRILVALMLLAGTALAAPVARIVDIDNPGTLDAIREQSPEHYAKIEKILAAAERVPAFEWGKHLPAAVGASDVMALPLWMVSDPPKLKLEFTLDDTRYSATVIGRLPGAGLQPAR